MFGRTGQLAAVLAAVLVLPAAAAAQGQGAWSFDAQGGYTLPSGDFADVADGGPTFGLGVAYWVSPRVGLRADGDVDLLSAAGRTGGGEGPGIDLWHYTAGAEFVLTDPEASTFEWTVNTNAGASTFASDEFAVAGAPTDFNQTYLALNGGTRLGWYPSPKVNVFLDTQWYLTFADEEETAVLGALGDGASGGFGTVSTFPITFGLKLRVP